MKLTYREAFTGVSAFNGSYMPQDSEYKPYLLETWGYYLDQEGVLANKQAFLDRLANVSEPAAKALVEKLCAFWDRTPQGDEIVAGEKRSLGNIVDRLLELNIIDQSGLKGKGGPPDA